MTDEKTLRVNQVSTMTGLRVQTVRELADAGEIQSVRVGRGRHRRFQYAEVLRYCRKVGLRVKHVDP